MFTIRAFIPSRQFAALLAIAAALAPIELRSDVIIGVSSTADSGAGSLRAAVIQANAVEPESGVILDMTLLQALNSPATPVINLNTALNLQRGMHFLANPGSNAPVLRSSTGTNRLILCSAGIAGTVTLSNLILENGFDPFLGGAIHYQQGTTGGPLALVLQGCTFRSNRVDSRATSTTGLPDTYGGAVYVSGRLSNPNVPSLTASNCLFESNSAYAKGDPPRAQGSAIFFEAGLLVIQNTRFSNNYNNSSAAAFGGAVTIQSCATPALFTGCVFTGNDSQGGVNSLLVSGGTGLLGTGVSAAVVESSLFAENGSASSGEAARAAGSTGLGGTLELRNTTFSGNRAAFISCLSVGIDSTTTLIHCTLADNQHQNSTGSTVSSGANGTVQLRRSVVAGNRRFSGTQSPTSSPDLIVNLGSNGTFTSQAYNFIGSATGIDGVFIQPGDQAGNNLNPLDPRLATLGDYGGPTRTAPPRPDSPLVDAIPASAGAFLSPDARALSRPQGNLGDIGAVELPRVPYTTWNLVIPDAGQRGNLNDPDGDGLENILEYLLGTDPTQPDPSPLVVRTTEAGKFLEMPRSTSVRPGFFTEIQIQNSVDLETWEPLHPVPQATPETSGQIGRMIFRYPLDEAPSRFFRLNVH
jgi:hypothetical protein